jgi:hypothetical protein
MKSYEELQQFRFCFYSIVVLVRVLKAFRGVISGSSLQVHWSKWPDDAFARKSCEGPSMCCKHPAWNLQQLELHHKSCNHLCHVNLDECRKHGPGMMSFAMLAVVFGQVG